MSATHVPASLFGFLRDLAANNDRDWFQANKGRYRREVQEPLLEFIAAFAAPLAEIAPRFVADPRPSGGSMFRIYRDVRFSKDKRPYKTHTGPSSATSGRATSTHRASTCTSSRTTSSWAPACGTLTAAA